MPFIFISYRWSDSISFVDKLYGKLLDAGFSRSAIFLDRTHIRGGERITTKIQSALLECEVFLPVIGENWLSSSNKLKLFKEDDAVRLEIRTAILRRIKIIPVLLDGVSMPAFTELPEDISSLADLNLLYRTISHNDFGDLLTDIKRVIPFKERLLNAIHNGEITYEDSIGLSQLPEDDRELIFEEFKAVSKSKIELQENIVANRSAEVSREIAHLLKHNAIIRIRVGGVDIYKQLDRAVVILKHPLITPRRTIWELTIANGWRKKDKHYIKFFPEIMDQPEGSLMKIGNEVIMINQAAGIEATKLSVKILTRQ